MASPQPVTFGAQLRRYRKAARLTQEALAARAGYSTVYIGMLERGERMALPATVDVLAQALELTAAEQLDLRTAAASMPSAHQRSPRSPRSPRPSRRTAAPPLVGREHELAVVRDHLAGARRSASASADGGLPVLLVAGEPGIGKTRLLDEAVVLADRLGWHVLTGGCQRREGEEAYAPVVTALDGYVRRQSPASLRATLSGAEWLVRVLPELATMAPSAPAAFGVVSPFQERRLIFQAVARFLANIARPAGVLLALDDLQWAGADALDLLTALVATKDDSGERPVRIIGAYRSTELSAASPLAGFLADLAGKGLVTRVALRPLGQEESAQLFDTVFGVSASPGATTRTEAGTGMTMGMAKEWREDVARRAAGVPFYLVSYAQGLLAGALSGEESGGSSGLAVPWTVGQTIRQRVAALAPGAQKALQVVAIAGRTAERSLVITVTQQLGQAEDIVGDGLDAACRAGLLREVGDDGYAFAHDLIREVVAADLGAAQRARLHRQMAAAIAHEAHPPAAVLAYHYTRAGDREHAAQYLELAGDQALEVHAYGEAEGYFGDLIAQCERLGRRIEVAHARERLGDVLISAGRYMPALHVIETAEEDYRAAGSVEGLGRTLVQLGQVDGLRGRASEGLARLLPRVEQLARQGLSSGGQAALLVTLGHLFTACSRYAELLTVSERAISLAREAGDERLEGRATMRRGIALAAQGRLDEAAGTFDTAVRVSEATGDLWNLSITLSNRATVSSRRGELLAARHHIEQARQVAQQFGGASMIVLRWCESSQIAFLLGEWHQARRDLERAMDMLRTLEESWTTAYALTCLGELTAAEGRLREADPLLERAIGFTRRSGDFEILRTAQRVAAELDLLDGRPAVAWKRLDPLRDHPTSSEHESEHETNVTEFLHLLAWAQLDLGDERAASTLAEESVARARAAGMRRALADGLRVRAQVAVRAHQWDKASTALDEALSLCRVLRTPYAEAKTHYGYGQLHLAKRGDSRAAREHFAAALEIFDRLGERLYAERVRSAVNMAEAVSVTTLPMPEATADRGSSAPTTQS